MKNRNRVIVLVMVLLAVAGGIWFLESGKTRFSGDIGEEVIMQDVATVDDQARIDTKEKRYDRAREITTPDGFINTDSFNLADLVGEKVILLDIWTYSCINCQRTLPYLNSWHEKYADDGLVIVGLHTPEFEFEKDYANVKMAVEKYGVMYPVVLDNDYSTWRAYENRYWPRKYLIDIDGFVVYDHIGEGAYEETEKEIVRLLNERSAVLGVAEVEMDETPVAGVQEVNFRKVGSPETYLGYDRMKGLVNSFSLGCRDESCDYDSPDSLSKNRFAFGGRWKISSEASTLVSDRGELIYRFEASKVNLVAGSLSQPIRAEILLDGQPISQEHAGSDLVGNIVEFSEHDLYNLVDLGGDYETHTIEIRFLDSGVEVFAFTFG